MRVKRFKGNIVIIAPVLIVAAIVASQFIPHASAKDVKSVLTASHQTNSATTAGHVVTASQTTALSSVVADMDAVINADPDGLSASATLVDLNTGQTYSAGASSTIFKAASTSKVLTAVDFLHEVEQGQASLSEDIDGDTAQDLMQQMIVVSDNDAWADLENFLGLTQEQDYATSIGMTNFTGGDYHTMTTEDEAVLLTKLYDGQLINSSDRSLLYSYMANTDSTNLIQAALPSTATVYHKYGELWGYLDDAAIVQYQGHDFVLVIFTNNSDGTTDEYDDQVTLIHSITDAAFKDITAS